MDALVFRAIRRLVKTGSLTITTANGVARTFGDEPDWPSRSASEQRRRGGGSCSIQLRLGEAFVDGDRAIL
jgi:cyclopropane-fatty-acyl-phospholipid synthase